MRVKTLGSSGARVASASTTQSVIACRAFFRIHTTSNAVHAAVPAKTSSIGRGPKLRPPASAAPSTTTACPLPVSATKLTPSIHFADAFNPVAPRSMQAFYNRPAQNYVMDKTHMVQRKKLLRCALHYAIIFASTVRDPPPFQSRTHSSILLLWWHPARPPRPRFFARALPDGPPVNGYSRSG